MFTVEPNEHITFGIAYQDEHLAVVEKPARVPTQPGKGHQTDTLLNGLFARWGKQLQNLGAARDFGLLHRLDKDTSGLLIVGLRVPAYDKLREMFVQRAVRKFYWAVCDGAPKEPSGVIRMPIEEGHGSEGRGPMKLAKIARGGAGKPAITAYRVLEQSPLACLVEARPVTGRLHQIRLHMEAIGIPVLGDRFYGPRRIHHVSPRLALHSHRVAFEHPITGAPVDVRTDWPSDLRRTLKGVGLHRPGTVGETPRPVVEDVEGD
ncbi:MAG TPA: RluA family pseudouridine synthase [Phycisphaerales bacterium]|jgi:23S rRNA pseudouridine1911/1915/1917 synthase|nr:RluA family pseudouridine synthase [Phycisphaerales bacterium]